MSMTIVGLEGCGMCSMVHEKFPNVKYVVVKKLCAGDKDCMEFKKALGKFPAVEHFPIVMNEDMTEILPLESLNS
jgi:hypothetical protein